MPKKKTGRRTFNPEAIKPFADPAISPRIGSGAPVYRFTVVVPMAPQPAASAVTATAISIG